MAVDVEAQDPSRLPAHGVDWRSSVDVALDETRRVLGQAHPDGQPVAVGEIGEVQMPCRFSAFRRRLVPGIDEARAFAEGVLPERLDIERKAVD
jgi:hypothetical protein